MHWGWVLALGWVLGLGFGLSWALLLALELSLGLGKEVLQEAAVLALADAITD